MTIKINTAKTIVVETNYHCNFRCIHCYVPDDEKTDFWYLSLNLADKLFNELDHHNFRYILLTGGEPLLHPDFFDLYLMAHRKNFNITLFTNGSLLDEEKVEFLSRYPPSRIRISCFGDSENSYQQITGKKGYEKVLRSIYELKENGINIAIKIPLLRQNFSEVVQLKETFKQNDIPAKIDVRIIPRFNNDTDTVQYRLEPDEILKLNLENVASSQIQFNEQIEANKTVNKLSLRDCLIKCQPFVVNPMGRLQLCFFVRDFSVDLNKHSFLEATRRLITDILAYSDQNPESTDRKCFNCDKKSICPYCPGWARNEVGSEHLPIDFLCRLSELYYDKYSKMVIQGETE